MSAFQQVYRTTRVEARAFDPATGATKVRSFDTPEEADVWLLSCLAQRQGLVLETRAIESRLQTRDTRSVRALREFREDDAFRGDL